MKKNVEQGGGSGILTKNRKSERQRERLRYPTDLEFCQERLSLYRHFHGIKLCS